MKTVLNILGMHCASCASTVESALKKVHGVSDVKVNYATQTAEVTHGDKIGRDELVKAVERTGYKASLPGSHHDYHHHHHHDAPSTTRLWVAGLLAIPLLFIAMGPMMGVPVPETGLTGLLMLLLTIIILVAGKDIYRAGVSTVIKNGRANMDTLIALGTGVAFLFSSYTVAVWLFTGHYNPEGVYFESAGLIITFVLLGRHLEELAKRRTRGALNELLAMAPETARLMVKHEEREVPVEQVKPGDTLKVKPGDKIPVDGVIVVGATRVNESMLTGEPVPVKKTIHDEVFAGTINKTGMFIMKAKHTGKETAFQRIVTLVEEAQRSQAPVQRVADQVSAVFVPVVLIIAVATFGYWYLTRSLGFALLTSISVLIIACPCALGLATPTAIMVSIGSAGKHGILFKNAASIQKAADVKMVAFDKTGTLTEGRPEVVYLRTYHVMTENLLLRYAASLESASEHPLGEAIVAYASERNIHYGDPREFKALEGKGVAGKVEGLKINIGSLDYFKEDGIGLYDVRERLPELAERRLTPVLVAVDGKLAGLIGVADPVKEHAKKALEELKRAGLGTVMLTGDSEETAQAVAKQLGIPMVRAQLLPEDKLGLLRKFKKKRPVAFVGDGINDAPALAAADVGIAIGSGTGVALETAGVVLLSDDLRGVSKALHISRRTMSVIKQNLVWAFGYNIVAIPLAAGVLYALTGWLLSPAIAGAAMAASSLSVVLNSTRLRKL